MSASVRCKSSFWVASIASLAAIALCLGARPVLAGDATLTWTAPTQRTDGSALTNLASYRIYYGTSATALTQTAPVTNPGLVTYTIQNLAPGTWYFSMTALDAGGLESARTNIVTKTILQAPPNPPGNLVVAALVVYQVIGTPDRFAMIPVGTVPAGTPCDPLQTINGRYAVPRAAVSWYGSIKPQIVVAQCS